jgi:hypothetical protein
MTDPHLVTLNPEQRHAVEHGVEPLLINAGAGSGNKQAGYCGASARIKFDASSSLRSSTNYMRAATRGS